MEQFVNTYHNFTVPIKSRIKFLIQTLRLTQLLFILSCALTIYNYGFTSLAIGCFSIALALGLTIENMRRRLLEMKIEHLLETGQIKET